METKIRRIRRQTKQTKKRKRINKVKRIRIGTRRWRWRVGRRREGWPLCWDWRGRKEYRDEVCGYGSHYTNTTYWLNAPIHTDCLD